MYMLRVIRLKRPYCVCFVRNTTAFCVATVDKSFRFVFFKVAISGRRPASRRPARFPTAVVWRASGCEAVGRGMHVFIACITCNLFLHVVLYFLVLFFSWWVSTAAAGQTAACVGVSTWRTAVGRRYWACWGGGVHIFFPVCLACVCVCLSLVCIFALHLQGFSPVQVVQNAVAPEIMSGFVHLTCLTCISYMYVTLTHV